MVRLARDIKGIFIVEVFMVLAPFLFISILLLEVIRRETFRVVTIHLACIEARSSALGDTKEVIETEARKFLESGLGKSVASEFWRASQIHWLRIINLEQLRWLNIPRLPGILVERWIRYPQFLAFGFRGGSKHHEEITERCLFPFL